MKPVTFEYERPADRASALASLAASGDDAKVLAGGQSLVPLMNFRLFRPIRLIDVNDLPGLAYVRRRDGVLRIGALTRQRHVELSRLVQERWPLLAEALSFVAHPQIRNRGTVGGSVAHADPAAELPAALAALDAAFVVESEQGTRTIPWHEFFLSGMTTALRPDELIVEIEVPPIPAGSGTAFAEFAPRHGDFALAAVAVAVTLEADGCCSAASIVPVGGANSPVRATQAERRLLGADPRNAAADAAAAAAAAIETRDDARAGAAYRRGLIRDLTARAIATATRRAAVGGAPSA